MQLEAVAQAECKTWSETFQNVMPSKPETLNFKILLHNLQFKAKAKRNALYEQDHDEDEEDGEQLQSSRKARAGKSRGKDERHAILNSKDGSHKKGRNREKEKKAKKKSRDASSDEEEEVQGLQLTNIMQIMEQQQR